MNKIVNMLKSFNHVMKRSQVIDQFNKIVISLNNEILPMVAEVSDLVKVHNITTKELPELSFMLHKSDFKAKDAKSLVGDFSKVLNNMNSISNDLKAMASKDLSELLNTENISIKEAGILNAINSYGSVVLCSSEALLYIVNLIDSKVNSSGIGYIKSKLSEIRNSFDEFGVMLKFFSNKNLIKDLNSLSNDRIIIGNKDTSIGSMLIGSKTNLEFSGFIGNPIYHFRLWLVDLEMKKYEALKDRKKLTELKIMELKARNNGEVDTKLQAAIQYHENKLEDIEYKIRKIEE